MFKANKPIKMRVLIAFFFLLTIASSISKEKKDHPKTIVEANHFFSSQKTLASYDVENIQKGKPLILLLKDIDKTKTDTDLTITLEEQAAKTSCDFKKKADLCIIANVTSSKIKMGIQCHTLPCQISWVLYQPQAKEPTANQIALNLFSLHDSKDHLIGQVTCNDPSISTLNADVSVYSEVPFKRAYKNNVLYLLFNNQKKGFVFIDIETASRACANISFKQPSQVLSQDSQVITNFIIKDSSVSYGIKEIPSKDFWLSCSSIRLDEIAQMKSNYKITLFGTIQEKQAQINTHQLTVSSSRSNDFTIVFKKPHEEYKKLRVEFSISSNQIILFDTKYFVSDSIEIELGQMVFFTLKKDQKLNLKVEKDEDAEDNEQQFFIPKRSTQVHVSKDKCLQKQDCQLTVTAVVDTQNMIFVSSRSMAATSITPQGQGLYEFEQIQFITIKDKVKRKAKAGDNIFFKRAVKKNEAIQVHINTPNAIIYGACRSKCQVPDDRCRERTGNYHHPFIYQAKQDCQLLMNVEALDNTEFQLTIISANEKYITLDDGTPFSYTMDSSEERVDFKFKLKEKSDVSFNLVSPLNSLKLFVSNGREDVDEDTSQQSTDGYILIQKGNIQSLDFTVSVIKMKDYKPFFTHFTLIVSSKQTNLRLEPTVTNYQTLVASDSRDFYFQFDPTQSYILSFYVYNLKNAEINLELKISDQEKEWKDAEALIIAKQSDYLDLSEISEDLCEGQGVQSCEIFLRITNKLAIEVDFTMTLLSKNAVIELKDGIWQAFPQTILTASSNFYFYPRHQDKNIFIYYHSSFQDIRITYNLWKYDRQQAIDPIDWPFPKIITDNQKTHADYKPSSYIIIDHEQMKQKCWPNCLLLVSFYVDINKIDTKTISTIQSNYNSFKIMASNNQIQLPQGQKMSLTIGQNEEKTMLIDLKYALDKQSLNFYASSSIGTCYIRANVYSQQKPTCPIEDESSDFLVTWGESQIEIAKIKSTLKDKGMNEDKNIYLCLGIHSTSSCKISVQFSTQNEGFKKISTDSFQQIKLDAYQIKHYQIEGFVEQYAKITRISGFPFVSIKKCGQKSQYKQCMEQFKNEQKGKQIVAKTSSFEEQFCVDCIYLFKFSTVEPSELNFHLQSKFTELQLKENNIISDFLNEGQTNKYQINANANEDLIINIHIQEGTIQTQVTNLNGVNLNKKSDSKNKILHFVIKSSKAYTNEQNGVMNPLAFSGDFVIYHVGIKSLQADKAASYTISYSSGKRELYLQDGLVIDYILEPNKVSTFHYYNEVSSSHVFYSISMDNATALNQLKIKSYYLEDPNDQTSKTEITLQRPKISKKTPNPTILFSLPQKNYFSFELTNPSSKEEKISMVINHQQVILLPFDHEFPFQLHKGEQLNLLVDVNIPGYIETTIRKCDKSQPQYSFTFDYEEFLKGTFMSQTKITDSSYTYNVIKANRIGTLYINFKADAEEDTMISFKVSYREQKNKKSKIIAGGKGAISYQLLTEKTATIKVPLALCDNRKPCKGVTYYYLSSNNQNEVYSQLVCSSSFFSLWNVSNSKSIPPVKINGHSNDKELTFDFTMSESLIYLGVKAVAENGEEAYYEPIEIASLWSKWLKVSLIQRVLMTLIVLFSIGVCCIFCRRMARKGYRPLEESSQY